MATRDNKALSELSPLTECCICLMPFTDPRMLPCIHSACLRCFEDIQRNSGKKPGDVIPCPLCRKEFTIPLTGMNGFQKNFFIANLLETTQNFNEETTSQLCKIIIDAQKDASEVTMKCPECGETFCERCAKVHKYTKSTRGHRVVEITGNVSEEELLEFSHPNCPNHPHKLLDLYCSDCKAFVCACCLAEKHTSHSCKHVTTDDKDFRKSLENSSTKMLHYIAQLEAEKSKMESKKTNFLEQASEIENAVRLKNQQLKAMIDEHTQLVLNELSSMKQKHLKNLEAEIEEIERQMTSLQRFETYCSEIKSKVSTTDIRKCFDRIIQRADDLIKENDEYLSRPDSVVDVKFNAADQDVLMWSSSNVIGRVEERGTSYAVIIGGYDSKSLFEDVTQINLHQPCEVSSLQKLPTEMKHESASAVYDSSVYITGIGGKYDEIWRFDTKSDTWKKCATLVKGRRRHSVAFIDQLLYVCGGYVDSNGSSGNIYPGSPISDVEAYDAINDRCSSVGKLVHCVQSAGNCVPFESLLYIFGGINTNNRAMSQVQVYDTKSNNCTLLSRSMPLSCMYMRAALFGKTFILLGKDNCFLYDLDEGSWRERRHFKTEVIHFGMITENGQIFVIGGGSHTTTRYGKVQWTCRDDVRCIPLKNIIEDKASEWRHHAKLSKGSLVYTCGKV